MMSEMVEPKEGGLDLLPGDTTASGLFMSKAAMLPIAKPYPEWTSGRPMER